MRLLQGEPLTGMSGGRLRLLTMEELRVQLERVPHIYQGMLNNRVALQPQYETNHMR